jgi:hypothetical protein
MADSTIWIDDVVTGRLPAVCVKSGRPADTWVRDEAEVSGPSLWMLLLVFLGPIGWIALVVMLVAGVGRQRITVELPFARDALDTLKAARTHRRRAGFGVAVVGLVGVLSPLGGMSFGGITLIEALVATAILAVVALAISHVRLSSLEVGVSLDASGRWVTLKGVSDEFAAMARADQRRRSDERATHRH